MDVCAHMQLREEGGGCATELSCQRRRFLVPINLLQCESQGMSDRTEAIPASWLQGHTDMAQAAGTSAASWGC